MEEVELLTTSPNSRISFSWGLGNELHLVECNASPAFSPSSNVYSNMRWGYPSSSERKTVYDILPIYQEFQQSRLQQGISETARHSRLIDYAQKVSASMASTLQSAGSNPGDLGLGRAIWDLLILFYARGNKGEGLAVSDGFADLVRRNLRNLPGAENSKFFARPDSPDFVRSATPEAYDSYWDLVKAAAALGAWTDLRTLLQRHSAVVNRRAAGQYGSGLSSLIEQLLSLLGRVPRYLPGAGLMDYRSSMGVFCSTPTEYVYAKKAWVEQCNRLLNEDHATWQASLRAHPPSASALETVLRIFTGDRGAIEANTASRWDLAAATALHLRPELQAADVPLLVRDVTDKRPIEDPSSPESPLWSLLVTAAEGKVQETLRLCSLQCSQTILAHVADLLAAPGGTHELAARGLFGVPLRELPGSSSVEACLQGERLLVPWIMSLAANETTWKAATSYLAWCPVYGQSLLDALLRRKVGGCTQNAKSLQSAVTAANSQDLYGAARYLYAAAAAADWQEEKLQSALVNFIKAEDDVHPSLVATEALFRTDPSLLSPSHLPKTSPSNTAGTSNAAAIYRGTLGCSDELRFLGTAASVGKSEALGAAAALQRVISREESAATAAAAAVGDTKQWVASAVAAATSEAVPKGLRYILLRLLASIAGKVPVSLTASQAEGLLRTLAAVSESDAEDLDLGHEGNNDEDTEMGMGSDGEGTEGNGARGRRKLGGDTEETMGDESDDAGGEDGDKMGDAQVRTAVLQMVARAMANMRN